MLLESVETVSVRSPFGAPATYTDRTGHAGGDGRYRAVGDGRYRAVGDGRYRAIGDGRHRAVDDGRYRAVGDRRNIELSGLLSAWVQTRQVLPRTDTTRAFQHMAWHMPEES